MDYGNSNKKAKETNKCVIERILKFNHYKYCLFSDEPILQIQIRFKSEAHVVYTVEINEVALTSKDDKRLQTLDRITTCPYENKKGKSMPNKNC